ncbi:MAG: hypothetical protein HUU55_13185 [Myxococcales bacterium]|nr:hypothetical protein [Myxococcales bacterium]
MLADEVVPVYGPQGLDVFIVHTGPDVSYAVDLLPDTGNTYPLILDIDDSALAQYQQLGGDALLFPLAYLVDKNGVIRHVYNVSEPEGVNLPPTLKTDIEALLAE